MKKIVIIMVSMVSLWVNINAMEEPEENKYSKIIQGQVDGLRQASKENDNYCRLLPQHIRDQVEGCISESYNSIEIWLKQCKEDYLGDRIQQIMYSPDYKYACVRYKNGKHREFDVKKKKEMYNFQNQTCDYTVGNYLSSWRPKRSHLTFYEIRKLNLSQYFQANSQRIGADLFKYIMPADPELAGLNMMISDIEYENKDVEKILSRFTKKYLLEQLFQDNSVSAYKDRNEIYLIQHIYNLRNEDMPIGLTQEQEQIYNTLPECLQNSLKKFIKTPQKGNSYTKFASFLSKIWR